jgi:hypothetical protein
MRLFSWYNLISGNKVKDNEAIFDIPFTGRKNTGSGGGKDAGSEEDNACLLQNTASFSIHLKYFHYFRVLFNQSK